MNNLGWDLDAPSSQNTFDYDPFAPAPAAPSPVAATVMTSSTPVTATTPADEPAAKTLDPMGEAAALLAPVLIMPVIFLLLRLSLTDMLGLVHIDLPWLVVATLSLSVVGMILGRLIGPIALWLGALVAVLAALTETLLVVAPVSALTALVTWQVLRDR